MINVLHISPAKLEIFDITKLLQANPGSIHCISMYTDHLLLELKQSGVISTTSEAQSLCCSIFNNEIMKDALPLASPAFITELTSHMLDRLSDSFLSIAYHYSIPIFLKDVSVANFVFNKSILSHNLLLSNEADWDLYGKIENLNKVAHLIMCDEYPSDTFISTFSTGNISDLTEFSHITKHSKIRESDTIYLYDKLLEDNG